MRLGSAGNDPAAAALHTLRAGRFACVPRPGTGKVPKVRRDMLFVVVVNDGSVCSELFGDRSAEFARGGVPLMHGMPSGGSSEEGHLVEEGCESLGLGGSPFTGGCQRRGGATDSGPGVRHGGAP